MRGRKYWKTYAEKFHDPKWIIGNEEGREHLLKAANACRNGTENLIHDITGQDLGPPRYGQERLNEFLDWLREEMRSNPKRRQQSKIIEVKAE